MGIHNIVPVEFDNAAEGEEPVRVAEQRVSNWQARWQRRAAEREARGEAEAIRIVEQARARALTELINAVEEGFRDITAHGNAARPEDVIALSFINAVEQMLDRQQDQPNFLNPIDPLTTPQDIRRLMQSSGEKQQEG